MASRRTRRVFARKASPSIAQIRLGAVPWISVEKLTGLGPHHSIVVRWRTYF